MNIAPPVSYKNQGVETDIEQIIDVKLDKKLAREFRDRWKAVEVVEAEERKIDSIELRWQQLNSILRMAIGLGLPTIESSDEDMIVYKRWAKLRNLMN